MRVCKKRPVFAFEGNDDRVYPIVSVSVKSEYGVNEAKKVVRTTRK